MDRLVPCTVLALAAGICASALPPPEAKPWILAASAAVLVLPGRRLPPAIFAAAFLLGFVRAEVESGPPPPDHLEILLPAAPSPVVLEGEVLTPADPEEEEGSCRFAIEVERIVGPGGPLPASGRVRVRLEEGWAPVLPGDRLRVTGVTRLPPSFRNPGARPWSPGRLLEVPGPASVLVLGHPVFPGPTRIGAHLREAMLVSIRRAAGGEGAALLEALLVGRKEGLDPGVVRDFRRNGTWHVLVVSGLHVAMAAAVASLLLARCGAGPRARAAGGLAAAALCALACGLGAPAARALLGVSVAALGPILRRRTDPVHALFVAAGILLAARPANLFDAGFQLSFAAVLGILRLAPAAGEALFAKRRFLRRFPLPAADRSLRRRSGDFLERWFPAALTAWAATAPLLALQFGTFSPVTPLANLVVLPAALGILAASIPLLALGAVAPALSGWIADVLAGTLGATARFLADLPGAWLLLPEPPAWLLLLDGALLALAMVRPRRVTLLGAAIGLAALAAVPFLLRPRPPAPSVLVLDVGHGLAVLADAGSSRVLYDAGGRGLRVGEDAVLPALAARGALRLDAVVVSHEDADHFGGLREVIESVPVGRLVVGPGFGRTPAGMALLGAAGRRGVPVTRAAAGLRLEWPGLRAEVLHPPRSRGSPTGDNDGSLVLRVRMEGLDALLAGDLEGPGIASLLGSGTDLRADVLVLPHHGSPTSEGVDALVAATRATTCVASAGAGTLLRGPPASPFARRFRVTAKEGAILLRPDPPRAPAGGP